MSAIFRALGIRNYRLWVGGALVSNIGTWMQRVAQDWLVLTVLTDHSGTAVGITTGLQFLPILFLGPYAGVLADRLPQAGDPARGRRRPWACAPCCWGCWC